LRYRLRTPRRREPATSYNIVVANEACRLCCR